MPTLNTNTLYAIIAVLLIGCAVLGWQLYQAKKEPQGLQINIGPGGASIQKK
jgi:predicted negative regulator of RcsB-dependent stress response